MSRRVVSLPRTGHKTDEVPAYLNARRFGVETADLPIGTFGQSRRYLPALRNPRAMPDSYIIEVNSETAGIVVRSQGGYCFFASSHQFNRLEGQLFRNAREAERAARKLVNGDVREAA